MVFEAIRNGRALLGVVPGSAATGPAAGAQDADKILDGGLPAPTRQPNDQPIPVRQVRPTSNLPATQEPRSTDSQDSQAARLLS